MSKRWFSDETLERLCKDFTWMNKEQFNYILNYHCTIQRHNNEYQIDQFFYEKETRLVMEIDKRIADIYNLPQEIPLVPNERNVAYFYEKDDANKPSMLHAGHNAITDNKYVPEVETSTYHCDGAIHHTDYEIHPAVKRYVKEQISNVLGGCKRG